VEGETNRVYCLDARTGKLVWKSDPVERAIHVVTVADNQLFTHAQNRQGYLLDAANGAKLCELTQGYRCTRFTMDGALLLGSNMDLIETAAGCSCRCATEKRLRNLRSLGRPSSPRRPMNAGVQNRTDSTTRRPTMDTHTE
jgi:hypothetical protein